MTSHLRRAPLMIALVATLAGCDPSLFETKDEPEGEASADGVVTYVGENRDVEAPEIFQVSDQGLWDGRPSLGGAWVAHPDVKDPQRVVIVNEANGTSITAALFRRERENPGPVFQLSSDAARELNVVPGQPVGLKVTALQKAPEPEPASTSDGETDEATPQEAAPDAAIQAPAETPQPAPRETAEASISFEEIEENTRNTVGAAEAALDRIEVGGDGVASQ